MSSFKETSCSAVDAADRSRETGAVVGGRADPREDPGRLVDIGAVWSSPHRASSLRSASSRPSS